MPKPVVVNGWIATNVIAPFQPLNLKEIFTRSVGVLRRAQRPFFGTLFDTYRIIAEQHATQAQEGGAEYLSTQ